MELITFLIDFILNVDEHLETFVQNYGTWVYALLFLIVFVETGVVVMPFLPGDSLLFVVGAMTGAGMMSYPVAVTVLLAAAILGVISAPRSSSGRTRVSSTSAPSSAPTTSTRPTAASPSSSPASCPSCAPLCPSWLAWPR